MPCRADHDVGAETPQHGSVNCRCRTLIDDRERVGTQQPVGDFAPVGQGDRSFRLRVLDGVAVEPVDDGAERFLRRDALCVLPEDGARGGHFREFAAREAVKAPVIVEGAIDTELTDRSVPDPAYLRAQKTAAGAEQADSPRRPAAGVRRPQRQQTRGRFGGACEPRTRAAMLARIRGREALPLRARGRAARPRPARESALSHRPPSSQIRG